MSTEMFVPPIDLASIPELSPVLKAACTRAHESGQLTIGQFLQSLTETEIDSLLDYARQAQEDKGVLMEIALFTVILANGEGLPVTVDDNLSVFVRTLILMLQAELMYREGLVELVHDRLSLESFDIRKLPLTPTGLKHFGGIKLIVAPLPGTPPDPRKPGTRP